MQCPLRREMKISPYWKTVIAGFGPVVTLAHAAVGDNVVTSTELVDVVLLALGAFGVWLVPNRPGEPPAPEPEPEA